MDEAVFAIGELTLRDLAEKAHEWEFKWRPDYWLTFGSNNAAEVWNFRTFGHTRPEERNLISHELLSLILREYSTIREERGRFHVDRGGAYWGLEKNVKNRFIRFHLDATSPNRLDVVTTRVKPLDFVSIKAKLNGKTQA